MPTVKRPIRTTRREGKVFSDVYTDINVLKKKAGILDERSAQTVPSAQRKHSEVQSGHAGKPDAASEAVFETVEMASLRMIVSAKQWVPVTFPQHCRFKPNIVITCRSLDDINDEGYYNIRNLDDTGFEVQADTASSIEINLFFVSYESDLRDVE